MKLALVAVALATIALAGCGTPAGPTTPAMEGGKYIIHLTAAQSFQPMDAKVPVNSTVVWVTDSGTHDVSAVDGSWSSDDTLGHKTNVGDRFEHTFTAPAVVQYECRVHASSGMRATLTVA